MRKGKYNIQYFTFFVNEVKINEIEIKGEINEAMNIKIDNYKVLFNLRILKSILTSFVDSFLVLYFLEVSDHNILPLGIYKLIAVITIYVVIFATRNLAKSTHRVNLMRIGILLDFVYFLTIILLKDKVIDVIYLVALLYGLEEGFYYSVYNMLQSDGVKNEERAKFIGTCTAIESILSILFPLLFGSLIYATGFLKSLMVVLIIVALRIILSFMFQDKNIPEGNKVNFKEFFKLIKNDERFKRLGMVEIFNGITYSDGAFSYIVTIYIIKVFSNSFSLGVFTSIFSMMTCIMGILFAKFIKKEHYIPAIRISTILTVIFLCLMIFKCNTITIILFNLFQTISKTIVALVNERNQTNLCNVEKIRKEYKVEYWLTFESYLVVGRIIGQSIFILMAYTNSNIIIMLFVVFLILFANSSIKLQKSMMRQRGQV